MAKSAIKAGDLVRVEHRALGLWVVSHWESNIKWRQGGCWHLTAADDAALGSLNGIVNIDRFEQSVTRDLAAMLLRTMRRVRP